MQSRNKSLRFLLQKELAGSYTVQYSFYDIIKLDCD